MYVAARGDTTTPGGLFLVDEGRQPRRLEDVESLSSLAWHPSLPVLYGVSGIETGVLHAWAVDGTSAVRLSQLPSGGVEPCHLLVRTGFVLVANYESGTVDVFATGDDGAIISHTSTLALEGGGPDPERQSAPHPHQLLQGRDPSTVFVIDLGADRLRRLRIDAGSGILTEIESSPVPAGTGPRHAVFDGEGGLWLTGELSSTVLYGRPDEHGDVAEWATLPSTRITGPARSRSVRNYPGDIAQIPGEPDIVMANRGYDSIARFGLRNGVPEMIWEIDSTVRWPQHLLPVGTALLVAGWDSSRVVRIDLASCAIVDGPSLPGPAWLLDERG